ncbi:uncharacterized protein LOC104899600 [Beta vulgaris subsp. vulgaris]|uniref:uncharacterized protein LOC104899600 n=1 Tax=Beta vulgaris subsp. vulgaris TaxID=3555 RepID=UPI002036679C|nr:uncharacterized protein LOC104899600 [Beta vulgaris subsp. vulgaris]XP_057252161.1 uncharacterized protein LOC104899600 [Beta vulgaris subsp. vulgaris]
MMEFQLKDTRKRTPAQVEDEIKEDKGFYEDEYGHLVVTAHLGDRRLEPFLPRFLHKIRDHYALPSTDFIRELGPADFAKKLKTKDDGWDEAILGIASSVVAVSIFTGVKRLIDCSGLIIGWDACKGEATILTSARLLKMPDARKNYYVAVRFVNGMIEVGEEDFVDFYHNLMTVKVKCLTNVKAVSIDTAQEVEDGTEVVSVGRGFLGTLVEGRGILHKEYPYFGCQELWGSNCQGSTWVTTEVSEGGPLITKDGHVCGIAFFDRHRYASRLPHDIITSCLRFFETNGRVVIPWFGIAVIDSNKLPREKLEKLEIFQMTFDEKTPYQNHVIVKEVYDNSPAKKLELRPGDIVRSHGGCAVSSSLEFLELLHKMFEDFNANSSSKISDEECDFIREIKVVTSRYGCDEEVTLKVDSVEASDKKFFTCWPEDGHGVWYGKPRFGSQDEPSITTYVPKFGRTL